MGGIDIGTYATIQTKASSSEAPTFINVVSIAHRGSGKEGGGRAGPSEILHLLQKAGLIQLNLLPRSMAVIHIYSYMHFMNVVDQKYVMFHLWMSMNK
jgi:hypothetical protein